MSDSIDLSAYLTDRDKLIRQDRGLRVDAAKLDDLSATEAKAEEIVRALRAEEAVSVWGAEHQDIEHPFPGMEFLTSRSVILRTKVFSLLHKVRSRYLICSTDSSERVCVEDAKGSAASCPLGRHRRRELLVEQDPGTRGPLRPGFRSANHTIPHRERPSGFLTLREIRSQFIPYPKRDRSVVRWRVDSRESR